MDSVKVRVEPFNKNDILAKYLGPSDAAKYMIKYLDALKCRSVIVEDHYVDRHYQADYAAYYATSFRAPSPICKRLHFFRGLSARKLIAALEEAHGD